MLQGTAEDRPAAVPYEAMTSAFEAEGYVHLRGPFTSSEIAGYNRLREAAVRDWCFVHGIAERPHAVADIVERFPTAALAAACRPVVLGLAEAVMGPVVQLDSSVLVGDPPVGRGHRGLPVCWHRDRFGFFPHGVYTRPLAVVVMVYLQDMTGAVGPLRVIPRSHIDPGALDDGAVREPHRSEVVVHAAAGDTVVLHHNLLHSGTHNTSDKERRFLGLTYSISGLRQGDNFDGPNCSGLVRTAQRTGDLRMLRLLGADPLIVPRQNSGFVRQHQRDWAAWLCEDEELASWHRPELETVSTVREALA